MTRKAFSQYINNINADTSLQACIDELTREIDTRKRLYDRWLAEGKLTWTEANERMCRLMGAHQFLLQHVPGEAQLKIEKPAQAPF